MSPVLYRPHRGALDDSLREVVEINDLPQLVRHLRRSVRWYPEDKLPTEENTVVKPYGPDDRTGMSEWKATWIVLVNGSAWGFTNGPLGDVAPALVPDHRKDEQDQ